MERHHLGEVVAVLAAQVLEQLAAFADLGQSFGRLLDRLAVERELGDESSSSASRSRRREACSANGPDRRAHPARPPIACRGSPVVAECRDRGTQPLRDGPWHRRARSPRRRDVVLVGVVDAGGVELVDLEPQQIDLAGPGPLVAAERREFGVDLGEPRPCGSQRAEVDAAELVERRSLRRRRQQRLMRVLAVQVDDVGSDLGERGHRGRAPVDVGPRTALGRDHAGEHALDHRRR